MKSRTLITLIPTTAGAPRCAVIRQAENPNCRVRAWRASPHTRASSQLRVKAWPMNVWSNSQPVSRYVNHTSPTRRLAHFPQLSHELSPATAPYKCPQPATISLPRCDCNLGHIGELCATLLQPLPVDPCFTPQRLADPFRGKPYPAVPTVHSLPPSRPGRTPRSTPRTSPASDESGGSSRGPGPLPKAPQGSELSTPRVTLPRLEHRPGAGAAEERRRFPQTPPPVPK